MLQRSDFNYSLPEQLIAQEPNPIRGASRLLVADGLSSAIQDAQFQQLATVLKAVFPESRGKVLFVCNDTKVYPARIRIQKKTGARGEVFVLEQTFSKGQHVRALLRPLKKLSPGDVLVADDVSEDAREELFRVVSTEPPLVEALLPSEECFQKYGEMPLPPYIERDTKILGAALKTTREMDRERYQTVYGNALGSCAAPTAGLHFTDAILHQLQEQGCSFAYVTLHVGLGTFQPVQTEHIEEHAMHREWFCVQAAAAKQIEDAVKNHVPIVFVGTTALRTVESYLRSPRPGEWQETDLFLYPRSKEDRVLPQVGQAILTNFHQPESTLVMLVAALLGYPFWQQVYEHAISKSYKFLSYGDSSLLRFR